MVLGGHWRIGPSKHFDECVRLSVQFFREGEPTCSLVVRSRVLPPSMMQHAVLLGRDSWVRFNSPSYRSLPPQPSDQRAFGELELVHHAPTGMSVYAIDSAASGGGPHRYEGAAGATSSDVPRLFAVDLVRSDASPALTGHCLVDKMSQPNLFSVEKHFVASGRQVLPLAGVADLEAGDILGVAHAPPIIAPLDFWKHDHRVANPPSGLFESLALAASPIAAPTLPSSAPLERMSSEQRTSFLRVWARLALHLRAVAFDLHGTGWTPEAITQLVDVPCKFLEAFRSHELQETQPAAYSSRGPSSRLPVEGRGVFPL